MKTSALCLRLFQDGGIALADGMVAQGLLTVSRCSGLCLSGEKKGVFRCPSSRLFVLA
jgi:hypothetical protein